MSSKSVTSSVNIPQTETKDLQEAQRLTSRLWSKHKSHVTNNAPYRSTISRVALGQSFISTVDCRAAMHVELEGSPTRSTLYLPLSGSMIINVAGRVLNVTPGAPGFIPQKTAHTFDATAIRCVLIEIACSKLLNEVTAFLGDASSTIQPCCWEADSTFARTICGVVDILLRDLSLGNWSAFPPSYALRMESLLLRVVARSLANEPLSQSKRSLRIGRLNVEEVQAWMEARLRKKIEFAELAHRVGMSRRRMQEAFRKAFHMTMTEYLLNLRLEASRDDLLTSRKSVTEVALGLGFVHTGRFATKYRRKFGESPSQTIKSRKGN